MQLSTLVILYNATLTTSSTLQSLLNCDFSNNLQVKVFIWNNGPHLLDERDIALYLEKTKVLGLEVKIFQDIRNIALSKIYNYLINKNNFDFFIPFDQDSYLTNDFFQTIAMHSDYSLILPRIESNEQIKFPYYVKHGPILKEGKVELNRVTSINSGIAIAKSLVEIFSKEKLTVFDERFAFYGIDTVFFLSLWGLYKKYPSISCGCFGKIKHSLAMEEEQEQLGQLSPARRLEYLYFFILYRLHYKQRSKLSVLFHVINKMRKSKIKDKESISQLLQCLIKGQHPRSAFSILDDKS